ncbi:hypothetical protein BS78_K329100 [Paspalum vaginatum]|uniref:Uncharacterized protein n=1 Tax=Paspalum vaginatum TaxID=158149 RepID=A0A9W8CEG1_9POAL|nr:hypothetical protein BS78_K329100 [Paspalum vaginatum]
MSLLPTSAVPVSARADGVRQQRSILPAPAAFDPGPGPRASSSRRPSRPPRTPAASDSRAPSRRRSTEGRGAPAPFIFVFLISLFLDSRSAFLPPSQLFGCHCSNNLFPCVFLGVVLGGCEDLF